MKDLVPSVHDFIRHQNSLPAENGKLIFDRPSASLLEKKCLLPLGD